MLLRPNEVTDFTHVVEVYWQRNWDGKREEMQRKVEYFNTNIKCCVTTNISEFLIYGIFQLHFIFIFLIEITLL
jgi:hypothetical protein